LECGFQIQVRVIRNGGNADAAREQIQETAPRRKHKRTFFRLNRCFQNCAEACKSQIKFAVKASLVAVAVLHVHHARNFVAVFNAEAARAKRDVVQKIHVNHADGTARRALCAEVIDVRNFDAVNA
jgi:hypothetical protein